VRVEAKRMEAWCEWRSGVWRSRRWSPDIKAIWKTKKKQRALNLEWRDFGESLETKAPANQRVLRSLLMRIKVPQIFF